jgi:hypothetical protein
LIFLNKAEAKENKKKKKKKTKNNYLAKQIRSGNLTAMLSLLPLRFPSPIASSLPSAASLLPRLARIPILRIPPRARMSAAPASTPEAATSAAVGEEPRKEAEDVVVQYVVLRRDLADAWPMGSVVAQGCHAAVAAVWVHRDHPDTAAYCAPDNLDRMHKACSTLCLVPTLCFLALFCYLQHFSRASRECQWHRGFPRTTVQVCLSFFPHRCAG